MNRSMRKIIFPLLLIFLLCSTGCMSLFFYPRKQLAYNPVAQHFSPRDVWFKASDGVNLHGWFFSGGPNAKGTVLVLHGNAENLSTHVNGVLWLVKAGFNLFIFDYRGYGKSEGGPSIQGVHLDAEASLKTLLSMPQVKSQIIVLGQSLGGAIAVYTVANFPYKDRIAALVVDSAFSGYRRIAREKLAEHFITWPFQYPLSFLFNDAYSPVKWIRKVSPVPILILHGGRDPVVPVHHAHLLFEEALQPKELWETTAPGHISSFGDEGIREKLVRYLVVRLGKMDQRLKRR
jgi:fermentation-respiration switch protein FrsA (DUF1100 family)